jgi:hypothetical protein
MKQKKTITDLLGKIDFSPDNVVAAAAENSVLFCEAIEFRRDALAERSRAKMDLEREQAQFDVEARRTAKSLGEKTTERQIESMSLLDDVIRERLEHFSKTEEMEEYTKLVVEAFRMRRDCLQIIGGLVRNELSMQSAYEAGAEKMTDQRRNLRERFPGGK